MIIADIVFSIFFISSFVIEFAKINDILYSLLDLLDTITFVIALCFDYYYLGGLNEFKTNYQKEK